MPELLKVVLIHVKALGEHGVVSAWWYDGGCADQCWVALGGAVTYEADEIDYWLDMVELPPVE